MDHSVFLKPESAVKDSSFQNVFTNMDTKASPYPIGSCCVSTSEGSFIKTVRYDLDQFWSTAQSSRTVSLTDMFAPKLTYQNCH